MSRVGKWKRQILLCLLGLGGLVIIAGSSAAAPVGTYPEQQQVTSELDEGADLKPASTAVVQAATPVDPDVKQQLIAEVYDAADLQPASTAVVQAASPVDPDVKQQPVAEVYEAADLLSSSTAGSSDIPPVDSDAEQQLVTEVNETSDLPSSSSAVVPSPEVPPLQQAKVTTPIGGGEQELKASVNQQSEPTTKGSGGGTEQSEYTWQDGDRTLTVLLQSDLVIDEDASIKDAMADAPGGAIVKSAGTKSEDKGLPVFKSQSGALMTLPGGVLLVLEPDWSQADTNAFFSSNSIKQDKVEELDYINNGYFIETDPGFSSLDLANSLATKEGVIVSSPNWWTEVTVK